MSDSHAKQVTSSVAEHSPEDTRNRWKKGCVLSKPKSKNSKTCSTRRTKRLTYCCAFVPLRRHSDGSRAHPQRRPVRPIRRRISRHLPRKRIPLGSSSRPACSMEKNLTPISWVHQAGEPLLVCRTRFQHGLGFTYCHRYFQSQTSGVREAVQRV